MLLNYTIRRTFLSNLAVPFSVRCDYKGGGVYEMKITFRVIARSPPWADDEAISNITNETAMLLPRLCS